MNKQWKGKDGVEQNLNDGHLRIIRFYKIIRSACSLQICLTFIIFIYTINSSDIRFYNKN